MENEKVKLLLIEDSKVAQMVFIKAIKKENLNYNYTIASSVEEAKDCLNKEKFDILLVDYYLEDGTAFDILELKIDTPIIVITAGASEKIAADILKAGASDYLVKDSDLNYLKILPITVENTIRNKKAQEKFTMLSHAIMSINDSIYITDLEGKIVFVNKAFCHTYGYTESEILEQNSDILFENQVLNTYIKNIILRKIESGWQGEIYNKKKDGEEFPVTLSMSAIKEQGKIIALACIAHDITQHKQAEKELKDAIETAKMASRMKSEFVATMSHEIRTPMNGVIGMIDLVLDTILNGEQRDCLMMAKFAASTMLMLINDILDFSKIESGKLDIESIVFSLHNTIQKSINLLKLKAKEKNLDLLLDIPENIPEFLIGDPERLKQIIMNIVNNAIKFTDKGYVSLKLDLDEKDEDEVLIHFSIKDTGIGIPKDSINNIFEVFTQADGSITRKYGGAGLGLSIAKSLVEMMKGYIWAESEVGKGSNFHFTAKFPIHKGEVENKEQKELPENDEQTPKLENKFDILLAEDNVINQKLIRLILEKRGHNISIVSNGREAIDILGKEKFDIILMDIQMPDMDGFHASRLIREKEVQTGGHIPIVALTAHALKGTKEKCLQAGMDDYISKPINTNELLLTIERLCTQ